MSFPRYPEYFESGFQWIGEIPIHWEIKPLKYVTECLDGKRIPLNGEQRSYKQGDVPYWGANAIMDYVDEALLDEDLVLIGEDGAPFLDPLKSVAFFSAGPVWPNNHIHVLRPDNQEWAKFLVRALNTTDYATFIEGATRQKLTQSRLMNIPICWPTHSERLKIVRFLDHETAKIDTLIHEQQRLIELLKEKRQAVISHAVTKGLDPDVPMKDFGVEWLGKVPAHWTVSRIKIFARIESGHTPDKKKDEYWVDCDIPWVSLNDSKRLKVVDYLDDTSTKVNELGIANSSARLLPARAVVFTRDASIGLSAITTKPMTVSQHLIAWLCVDGKLIPEFLLLIFYGMEKEFERYTFGATIKTIGMDDVRSLTAAFPPLEEQKQLVEWAFTKKKILLDGLDAAEKTILLLKERRSALISAAVTGKIDVRDWQPPADESVYAEEERHAGVETTT